MRANARPLLMFVLLVDGVFVMFSCEFCNSAELTGVANLKCGAACRSQNKWAEAETV